MERDIYYKNVFFKDEESKNEWQELTEKEPERACSILIGRNISLLESVSLLLEEKIEESREFEWLSESEKEKAFKISKAAKEYLPEIKSGKAVLDEDSQRLLDAVSNTVFASKSANELAGYGQEIIDAIEELAQEKQRIMEKGSFERKTEVRNAEKY